MASSQPLSVAKLQSLFAVANRDELELGGADEVALDIDRQPSKEEILAALEDIQNDTVDRGFELKEVGSGWRFQVVQETARWINRLWEEKPTRYSRALMETLSLIAYRQPITRGDIESIRGVAVSSNIIRTLTEREWVKVVGHRDVPGRPALYATTKEFLDYFNINSLDQLPSLKEIQDIENMSSELELLIVGQQNTGTGTGNEQDQRDIDIEANMSLDSDSDSDSDSNSDPDLNADKDTAEDDQPAVFNVVHLDPF